MLSAALSEPEFGSVKQYEHILSILNLPSKRKSNLVNHPVTAVFWDSELYPNYMKKKLLLWKKYDNEKDEKKKKEILEKINKNKEEMLSKADHPKEFTKITANDIKILKKMNACFVRKVAKKCKIKK